MKSPVLMVLAVSTWLLVAQTAAPAAQSAPKPATAPAKPLAKAANDPQLPYSPSLDLTAMDRTVDPCLDFYQFACGGWIENNPIPPDQSSWSSYRKMQDDNRNLLRALPRPPIEPSCALHGRTMPHLTGLPRGA